MNLSLSGVSDSGREWSSRDFVKHYYRGGGKAVLLRNTGHLVEVVDAFLAQASDRLFDQIADAARGAGTGRFVYDFRGGYQMQDVVFSLGNTVIKGDFVGSIAQSGHALLLTGKIDFNLEDSFTDRVRRQGFRVCGLYDLAERSAR